MNSPISSFDRVAWIAHRVNTVEQLRATPREFGVELDLRDHGDQLILAHDPFVGGERFEDYLAHYQHGLMVLNIKSERIESRVLEAIARAGTVRDYFFLDCSLPMVRQLMQRGEHRIAARVSEIEPVEGALALAGSLDWVWIDCFSRLILDASLAARLAGKFKICLVSPELQGHPVAWIAEFAEQLRGIRVDAICTKRIDLWQKAGCNAGEWSASEVARIGSEKSFDRGSI